MDSDLMEAWPAARSSPSIGRGRGGEGRLLIEVCLRGVRARIQDDYTICIFSHEATTRTGDSFEIATQLDAGRLALTAKRWRLFCQIIDISCRCGERMSQPWWQ